jgi:hypothetical protein
VARVETTDRFDREVAQLRSERHRVDEVVTGLRHLLTADPTLYELVPGTQVRSCTTRAYEGAADLTCVYSYDEATDTVQLLSISVV